MPALDAGALSLDYYRKNDTLQSHFLMKRKTKIVTWTLANADTGEIIASSHKRRVFGVMADGEKSIQALIDCFIRGIHQDMNLNVNILVSDEKEPEFLNLF